MGQCFTVFNILLLYTNQITLILIADEILQAALFQMNVGWRAADKKKSALAVDSWNDRFRLLRMPNMVHGCSGPNDTSRHFSDDE